MKMGENHEKRGKFNKLKPYMSDLVLEGPFFRSETLVNSKENL